MLQVTIPPIDPPKQQHPIYGNIRRSRYNIVIVALCFAVIFSAYNTLQNYITTLFPTLGQSSLAILYAVAGISVFAGPAFTAALGARLTMIVGGACYVVYVASLAAAATPAMSGFANALIYIASAVIGFGAAILWVALGVFITQNSTRTTYATNTGIFWSVFQLNNIIGNLTTWAIYTPSLSSSPALYLGFAGVATVGTLMLFALRPPPRFATSLNGDEIELNEDAVHIDAPLTPLPDPYSDDAYRELSGVDGKMGAGVAGGNSDHSHGYNCARSYRHFRKTLGEAGQGAWAAALHLKDANMLLLLPIFILSGAELAFWTGEFTQLLGGATQIGLVLSLSGFGEIAGGNALGVLSDVAGRSASLISSLVIFSIGLWLACAVKAGTSIGTSVMISGSPLAAFIAAFLFGFADAGFNANAYAMCSQLYGGTTSEVNIVREKGTSSVGAYTIFQLVQNAGSAVWYPLMLYFPMHDTPAVAAGPGVAPVAAIEGTWIQVWGLVFLLVATAISFIIVDRRSKSKFQQWIEGE